MNQEKQKYTPAMQQYVDIKEQHKDCILFYRMGDFYELFFEDAKTVAKEVDITLTSRGKGGIPMCGVPFHAYENYMARLIRKGYKVALCEQIETPEQAKKARGSGAVVKREVVRIITQGTLTEENLLGSENNYLCSVFKNSVSWIDISTGDFFTKTLSETELDFLIRLNPSEILLDDSADNFKKRRDIYDYFKKKITFFSESKFNTFLCEKELKKTFQISDINSLGTLSENEIISSGIILQYLYITNKTDITNIKNLQRETEKSFMEIDAFSFSNLEIVENINGETGKGSTLFSVIDRTKTANGKRLLKNWIKNPLNNLSTINKRLDSISFFETNISLKEKLQDFFTKIPDIERCLSRLSLNKGGPRDLKSILDFTKTLPFLRAEFSSYKNSTKVNTPERIASLFGDLKTFDDLQDLLENSLEENSLPLLARDGNFIKEFFNIKLDEYISLMQDSKSYIASLQQKYSQISGATSLKIKFNNMLGYYIETPARQAEPLFENKELFIHRQTMANAIRFSTTELAELEGKIREAETKKQALELKIFEDLTIKVLEKISELRMCSDAISELDIFTSLSELATEDGYSKPKMTDSTDFDIKNGRHPVVEYNLKKSLENDFIGNNCILANTSKEHSKIWILTGPNMAGKSTFLRQNALIAILAHIGCYIPAEQATIGLIDKVFSRVGASDNLAKGQSTFMVEMIETSAILNKATDKSLVILDEIGRGTATFDGLSIAWSVMEYLNKKSQCRCLFATHYHELTELSSSLELVSNHTVSIKEWNGEVIFMHKVIPGTADKSYGIHVAKIAGLPSSIIKRSEEILETLESDNKKTNIKNLSNNLSLFDDYIKEEEKEFSVKKSSESHKIKEFASSINPDELSPKDALNKLYELQSLIKEEDK